MKNEFPLGENIILDKGEHDDMLLDLLMDRVACTIMSEYILLEREEFCTCPSCIVERMAQDHGGIQ